MFVQEKLIPSSVEPLRNQNELRNSSSLNNRTIETFALSDNRACSLIWIAPEDTDSFTEYLKVADHFHLSDFEAKNPNCSQIAKDEYIKKMQQRGELAKLSYKKGELPLIVLSLNGTINGGSFYSTEDNHSIIRMQIASVDRALPKEDYALCFEKIVSYLSNPNYFPHAQKFVVMARKWSQETDLLKELCTESSYNNGLYDQDLFTAYERKINPQRELL